uniref:Uncharacterized protein n=1 Tax=Picea glauca TaxID=3330 RepID=A0A101M1S4_PICGL|nr:hypothetical protein ABT39_MTgene3882 [Picea glauca]QHR90888.1 hypothetical protein Q903MT_gene4915 [Picea sitchensis]
MIIELEMDLDLGLKPMPSLYHLAPCPLALLLP